MVKNNELNLELSIQANLRTVIESSIGLEQKAILFLERYILISRNRFNKNP